MQACQLIVLVPSRELGVQTALLAYKLFGGSISQGIPGNRSNMFKYTGPRNLQVLLSPIVSDGKLNQQAMYVCTVHDC